MSNSRNSNIELLRIFAMCLILLHHFCIYGTGESISFGNLMLKDILLLGGKIGVNVFVLISGFFLVKGKFKFQSFLRVLLEAWLYSLCIGLLCRIFFPEVFEMEVFIKSFLPTQNGLPWFVVSYLGLYLLSPWLTQFVRSISRLSLKRCIIIGFLVLSVVPTFTGCLFVTSNLSWFVYLYIVAGFVRLYGLERKKVDLLLYGGTVFLILSVITILLIGQKVPFVLDKATYFANMYTVPTLFVSVGLFARFRSIKIRSSRIINTFASGTFGVYLIHENPFMRELIWPNFTFVFTEPVFLMLVYLFVICILLYVLYTAIDLIRLRCLERPLFNMLENKLCSQFNRINTWFDLNKKATLDE